MALVLCRLGLEPAAKCKISQLGAAASGKENVGALHIAVRIALEPEPG